MKGAAPLMLFVVLSLYACQQGKQESVSVADSDSTALLQHIAADTGMQMAIERSYEYRKELAWNQETVYDLIAGGTPTGGGNLFVVRRKGGTTDTLIRDQRKFPIVDAALCDADRNRAPELYFTERSGNSRSLWRGFVLEPQTASIRCEVLNQSSDSLHFSDAAIGFNQFLVHRKNGDQTLRLNQFTLQFNP